MSQQITSQTKLLRGIIIKVKYYNINNNFGIIIMKCMDELSKKGHSIITCKGTIFEPHEGNILILKGNFVIDDNYGEQFNFHSYENSNPLFEDEIIAYLSSGLIKEVDYITAKKIYDKFKEDTIKVLDTNPEQLKEIKGIGKLKCIAIINSWKQHREDLETHLLFQQFNISLNIIEKIKKLANKENLTIKDFIIKYNYNLIYKSFYMKTEIPIDDDIDDIKTKILSFNNIDSLIESFSNELFEKYKKSYDRIQAAMYTCILNRNYENGYTCQPYNIIINMTSNNLFINYNEIDNIFKENYNKSYVIFENNIKSNNEVFNSEEGYLYCIEDYKYEINNCNYLSAINIGNKNNIDDETLNSYINNIELELNIKYNENQINAIKSSINNNITIITGGPGTGKTTIIKGLINILIDKFNYIKEDILLLAPTGKAAKRLMESTNFEAHTLQLASWCKYEEYIYPSSIIIIDEASMISNKLLYQFLRHITNQKLIFVGDIYQLPSISPGNILSDLINSKKFPVITLKQIYRQENGYIILNAHYINNGIFPILNKSESNDFFYLNNKYTNNNYNQILNKILDIIYNNICNNDIEIMKKELQILSPMKNNGDNGINNINNYMQSYYKNYNYNKYLEFIDKYNNLPNEEKEYDMYLDPELLFKFSINKGNKTFNIGDKVINTVNDYENMIFNGETGIITKIEISYDEYMKHIDDLLDDRVYKIKDSMYEVYVLFDDNEIKFTYEKLDSLQLSYALTIHKSQGSEYKWVIIFLNRNHNIMLQRNLLYTAITRAKEKLFLISDDETIQKAINNNTPNIKLTLLKERLINEGDESYQKILEKLDKK